MDFTLYALLKAYVKQSIENIEGFEAGKSAYEIALDNGFQGSEQEWLLSLQGESPYIGENGNWFVGTLDTGVSAIDQTKADKVDVYTKAEVDAAIAAAIEAAFANIAMAEEASF